MLDNLLKSLSLDESSLSKLKELMPMLNEKDAGSIGDMISMLGEIKDGKIIIIDENYETEVEVNEIEKSSIIPIFSAVPMMVTLRPEALNCGNYGDISNIKPSELLKEVLNKDKPENEKLGKILCVLSSICKKSAMDLLSGTNKVKVNGLLYYIAQIFYFSSIMANEGIKKEAVEVIDTIKNKGDIPIDKARVFPIVSLHLIAMRYKEQAVKENRMKIYTLEEFQKILKEYEPKGE